LIYFAGSFGWIITLLREGKIGGESLFWSMQSISTLINPPYALSLIILLFGLTVWLKWRANGNKQQAIVLGLIFALIAGIKVYGGILIGLSLFFFWLVKKIRGQALIFDFYLWLTDAVFSLAILILIGAISRESLLIFKPFWFTHSMVESLDKLYWPKLALLRINLIHQWFSWKLPFLLAIELFLVLVFLVGNLGTRAIGLVVMFSKFARRAYSDFDCLMGLFFIFSLVIPLAFIQKGTAWNTIQFFYYFLFFANLYLALFLARLMEKKSLRNGQGTRQGKDWRKIKNNRKIELCSKQFLFE